MTYTYNKEKTIRTAHQVEKVYSTNRGFIGRLQDVEYLQSDDSWRSQGSRWLINEDDAIFIMNNGHKSATL